MLVTVTKQSICMQRLLFYSIFFRFTIAHLIAHLPSQGAYPYQLEEAACFLEQMAGGELERLPLLPLGKRLARKLTCKLNARRPLP